MRADLTLINVVFTRAEVGRCIVIWPDFAYRDSFHDLKLRTWEKENETAKFLDLKVSHLIVIALSKKKERKDRYTFMKQIDKKKESKLKN